MKKISYVLAFLVIGTVIFFMSDFRGTSDYCLIGAFIADKPTKENIEDFQVSFGKKPYVVMVFVDWDNFVDGKVIRDVYAEECVLMVTWEPWYAVDKRGIDYNAILTGNMDSYIRDFAKKLKRINKPVFLRFAHEMNGDWYPWSASKIGAEKYIAIYRHIKDIFDDINADNVRWVFSINSENVPRENNYTDCYPGDGYVNFIGMDGYNWGNTKPWSKWVSFKEIFQKRCNEITTHFKKPIIISEFSTTSSGGDKAAWIRDAMANIKEMKKIKAFVLFNLDKETDWSFPIDKDYGKELRSQLSDNYFKDKGGLDD
ncbi:MAG: dockerin [Candidatus Omnitrophica bacterium]|nr:dockerin [Candidatus Omnitrophota bacterium]